MAQKDSRILIVGAGAWGLSTALHLHRAGFENIRLFDRAKAIPSPHSAANDLNKIIRAEYEDPFYTKLALEAIGGWKTAPFSPHYHQTGYVVAATARAPPKAVEHLEKALSSIENDPRFSRDIRRLNAPDEFKDFAWQYSGPLTGFRGYYNRLAGYAHSANALKGTWEHLSTLGVSSVFGEQSGKVVELVFDHGKRRCNGVRTADDVYHPADLVICALGANGAALIPSLGNFNVARSWSVAHVQLTEDETNLLRGMPVMNVRDLGFFFEPDPATRLFKICPLGIGYTNTDEQGVSLPPTDELPPPQDFIPPEDERKLRQLLRETFPWMANRPFVDQKLCWFSDTEDSNYCIDFVPNTDKSVISLSGDSGHGFKMMPIFGQWVISLMERGSQDEARWKWRNSNTPGQAWGESVSWRIGQGAELQDLIRMKEKLAQARL